MPLTIKLYLWINIINCIGIGFIYLIRLINKNDNEI